MSEDNSTPLHADNKPAKISKPRPVPAALTGKELVNLFLAEKHPPRRYGAAPESPPSGLLMSATVASGGTSDLGKIVAQGNVQGPSSVVFRCVDIEKHDGAGISGPHAI